MNKQFSFNSIIENLTQEFLKSVKDEWTRIPNVSDLYIKKFNDRYMIVDNEGLTKIMQNFAPTIGCFFFNETELKNQYYKILEN